MLTLAWADYIAIGFLLGISTLVGIYYGCIRSKQTTKTEFLIASGTMGVLPTALSLYATLVSASTLLGVPVEIYYFGTQYCFYIIGWIVGVYVATVLFIPKFRELGLTSIYLYLERRFSKSVQVFIIIKHAIIMVLFMSVNLYGPSLALSQVTGINIWLCIGACGLICTFYTTIGGMRAVIWTDAIQSFIMLLGVILSIVLGFIQNGGVARVIEINRNGNRLNLPSVSLNPSIRYTYTSLIIGSSLYAISSYGCLQISAQRFLCVKSTRSAKFVAWLSCGFLVLTLLLSSLVAFNIYAKYNECDPIKAKLISKADQLYPLFVMETFKQYPGLAGLFIGSILSASLSTISSGINSVTTIFIEDIFKKAKLFPSLSCRNEAFISQIISTVVGIASILFAFVMTLMENNISVIVYQLAGSFIPIILGIFLLGFFAPKVNSQCVFFALLIGIAFQSWVLIGAMATAKQHSGKDGRLTMSIKGCLLLLNQTLSKNMTLPTKSNIFLPLYSISFLWYNINGVALTIISGLLATLIFNSNDRKSIDRSLLCSWKEFFGSHSPDKKPNTPGEEEMLAIEKEENV